MGETNFRRAFIALRMVLQSGVYERYCHSVLEYDSMVEWLKLQVEVHECLLGWKQRASLFFVFELNSIDYLHFKVV